MNDNCRDKIKKERKVDREGGRKGRKGKEKKTSYSEKKKKTLPSHTSAFKMSSYVFGFYIFLI